METSGDGTPDSQMVAPQGAVPDATQPEEKKRHLFTIAEKAGVAPDEFIVFRGDTILFHTANSSALIEWGQENKPGPVDILCPSSPDIILIVGDKEDPVVGGIIERLRARGITEHIPTAAPKK